MSEPIDYLESGMKFFQKGDYHRAIHYWEKARKLNPTDETTLYSLATAYYNNRQIDQAWKIVMILQRHHPDHKHTHQLIEILTKVRQNTPDYGSILYGQGDVGKILFLLKQITDFWAELGIDGEDDESEKE